MIIAALRTPSIFSSAYNPQPIPWVYHFDRPISHAYHFDRHIQPNIEAETRSFSFIRTKSSYNLKLLFRFYTPLFYNGINNADENDIASYPRGDHATKRIIFVVRTGNAKITESVVKAIYHDRKHCVSTS
jgi:hypothetical protein